MREGRRTQPATGPPLSRRRCLCVSRRQFRIGVLKFRRVDSAPSRPPTLLRRACVSRRHRLSWCRGCDAHRPFERPRLRLVLQLCRTWPVALSSFDAASSARRVAASTLVGKAWMSRFPTASSMACVDSGRKPPGRSRALFDATCAPHPDHRVTLVRSRPLAAMAASRRTVSTLSCKRRTSALESQAFCSSALRSTTKCASTSSVRSLAYSRASPAASR